VTTSGKTQHIEEQTVFSWISLFYIHRLFFKCAETEKSVFCRCSYVTKSPGSDQTWRRTCSVWFEHILFVPPKSGSFQIISQIVICYLLQQHGLYRMDQGLALMLHTAGSRFDSHSVPTIWT